MKLGDLLFEIDFEGEAVLDLEIEGIFYDSRKVVPKSLFICLVGENTDGHNYVKEAQERGAAAIVCQRKTDGITVPQIVVKNSRAAYSKICANLYSNPQNELKMIAITGTNGKTTTSYLLASIISKAGFKAGLIGTEGTYIGEQFLKTDLTTPDPETLFKVLREMANCGVKYVVMEASAHALYLDKLDPITFEIGIFTNFTQDHLDYFQTMENYKHAKLKLFSKVKVAILNVDDPVGYQLSSSLQIPIITYGLKAPCDVFAVDIVKKPNKTSFVVNLLDDVFKVQINLLGEYNIYNALAASSAAAAIGISAEELSRGLAALKSVPGRLNSFLLCNGATAIIDFAHTPDGIVKVLSTLKQMPFRRIITVFGCGGNRDKKKRPLMGRAAEKFSDFVILTSDNPRYENPELILDDIEHGMKKNGHTRIVNREIAVCHALDLSKDGDVVAILGKGAEEYQDINGVKAPYSDLDVVHLKNEEMAVSKIVNGGKI